MLKGVLKAVFAPAAAGLITGNAVWQGLSVLATGEMAATMAQTPQPINAAAAIASIAAAGITGYMLGRGQARAPAAPKAAP